VDIPHRWSTQDASPVDKLPYAGSYTPLSRHLFVNAGGQKWGMTNGTAGALILAERFAGREHPQAQAFDPNRLAARALPGLAKEGAQVGAHFVGDRIRPADGGDVEDIAPGEAAVLRASGVARTGVFRDDDGALHAVSIRCTHLGCLLRFNDAERSWDCPCHGSRFDVDGTVLAGPATQRLERRELP
jgi:nitrite reductase/ring-hydroxylating ferredoxin subunit